MASNFMIDFHGLDKDIADVLNKYPDETLKFMHKQANGWKKDCNEKGYDKYKKLSSKEKTIKDSWKKVKEENNLHQVTEIQIQNTHNLFHLLENGHVKVLWGRRTGSYVQGKHWAEKTREEWRKKFGDNVESYVDDMLKKNNL